MHGVLLCVVFHCMCVVLLLGVIVFHCMWCSTVPLCVVLLLGIVLFSVSSGPIVLWIGGDKHIDVSFIGIFTPTKKHSMVK